MVAGSEPDTQVDGFGTLIEVVPHSTPQFKHVLSQKLTEVMGDFIEGRASIKSIGNEPMTFVMLSDVLVDCTDPGGKP